MKQIPDQDKNQLIVKTHYYNWLKENKVDNLHYVKTKRQYLDELGIDKISSEELSTLKVIEQTYCREELNLKV